MKDISSFGIIDSTNRDLQVNLMQIIENDTFYEFIQQYDPDSNYHFVGAVDYHLLCDDKSYEGIKSHREALRFVFDLLVKDSVANQENARKKKKRKVSKGRWQDI